MLTKLSSDVNDNPPEFASKYYFASIREGEPVATEVVGLMASSRDTGVNAEITYSIIGGNEGRKFMIKSDTGLVSVAGEIDHERAKEYFLTVQAKDGGSPPPLQPRHCQHHSHGRQRQPTCLHAELLQRHHQRKELSGEGGGGCDSN